MYTLYPAHVSYDSFDWLRIQSKGSEHNKTVQDAIYRP